MNGKCQGIGFPKPRWPVSHELTMLCWWVHDGETLLRAAGGTGPPLPSHQGQEVSSSLRNLEDEISKIRTWTMGTIFS